MRKFNIKVNGKLYEVEVEEITAAAGSVPAASVISSAPAAPAPVVAVPQAAPAPVQKAPEPNKETAPAPKPAGQGKGETLSCPMPGTILAVNTKQGDIVKAGDVLFILDAMKMENEIMAPCNGKVVEIGVAKGNSVNTGDMLAVIE